MMSKAMGHESQIELWSPNGPPFCFVGFGTDRLRRQQAMKTAGRENPNHGVAWPRNRAHGAEEQNRSRSIKWAEKQEKFQPKEMCFFLTSPFIELTRMSSIVPPVSDRHPGILDAILKLRRQYWRLGFENQTSEVRH